MSSMKNAVFLFFFPLFPFAFIPFCPFSKEKSLRARALSAAHYAAAMA